MTIDEIADFCEFKDCKVAAGAPEQGFVRVNGRGIDRDSYTWGRFNMFGEVKNPPSPEKILETASLFLVQQGSEQKELTREQFEKELQRFLKLVGA